MSHKPRKEKYTRPRLGRKRCAKIVAHGITDEYHDSFTSLKHILAGGFAGFRKPNVYITKNEGKRSAVLEIAAFSELKQTKGDRYSLVILTPEVEKYREEAGVPIYALYGFLKKATPRQILRIDVHLNKELSPQKKTKRKEFYRKKLKGFTIRFV